ncbi:MAG: alkaline phosphatase family protein [Bacteroidales bacterium]
MKTVLYLFILLVALPVTGQTRKIVDLQPGSRLKILPYDRMIQPAGIQIIFGDATNENHAMDASLSPDGNWLAVQERYSILFIRTTDNSRVFILKNASNPDLNGGMNTYSGITWHNGKNGPEVYWSTTGTNGRSFVASATWNGKEAKFSRLIEFKAVPPAKLSLPNELLILKENSVNYLYVVLNGNNQLVKLDLESGKTIWTSEPGSAPYGIAHANGKIYVTNWAGRLPEAGDKEVAGLPWGSARVDNTKGGSTREGSVAVIDPATGSVLKHILTGLHPNSITSDYKGSHVYITNSNSDNISVVSTTTDEVTETISTRLEPGINPYFGDSPNGLCLSRDGRILYAANGMDNALAVISLGRNASLKGKNAVSKVTGFIPTGAYPAAVSLTADGRLYVSNLEGEGVTVSSKMSGTANPAFNSHRMFATISVIQVPGKKALERYTDTVIALNNISRAVLSREAARANIQARAVPERAGEPSYFRHVLYIIKENRTYDQILGDMKQGDGDPGLCIYGEEVTPNTHKLSEEFMLLDNMHVSGKCSAEGHQWTDASIVTDYIEKNMRAWFRSYAHVQTDALVYAPTGFIWDNAIRHGRSVRIYGEASEPVFPKKTTWKDVYDAYIKGEKVEFSNKTTIDPVRAILSPDYPSYGNHEFPDVMRADAFIRELKKFEELPGDQLPELMVMALPNDHTAGTRATNPTPRAMVADNDLALGRIVEAVSRSRFWNNTVIFVIEDDSQGGWDHVSAYRTVGLVISPYSRLRKTNHTYYNQPSIIRTIEQILGMAPMNIQDAIARPMYDCFSDVADLAPYICEKNRIPLDEMNPQPSSLTGKALYYARKSMLPEFDGIDSGNDDLLNRILWFAARGTSPYPSKYAGAAESGDDDEELEK